MRRIWAVARQTFLEAIRTRVTIVFIVALAGMIVLLPRATGAGTLMENIQSFLAYSVTLTSLALAVLAILLGCGLLCGEVQTRQIFAPLTKPISRWQYVLGRWLGIGLVLTVLVSGCGAGIYATSMYLRQGQASKMVQERMKAELFTARVKLPPMAPNVERQIQQRWDLLDKENRLRQTIEDLGGGEQGAAALRNNLRMQVLQTLWTAGPSRAITWRFEGLRRPSDSSELVEFRFLASASRNPPDDILPMLWTFANPATGEGLQFPRGDLVRVPASINFPAGLISENGELIVQARNIDYKDPAGTFRTNVMIVADDVYMLYSVGGYTWNFVRGMVLVLCMELFLAAMAIFAASFLSFPAACLVSLCLFILAAGTSFISQSTEIGPEPDVWIYVGHYAWSVVKYVVPDLSQANPSGALVDGLMIEWTTVLRLAGKFVLGASGLALGLACVIFSRRELARVIA